MAQTSVPEQSVFAPGRRRLTIGLVLAVTLVGFESLAVSTALPAIAADLNGLALYGWVFSAYMLGTLLGTVIAGRSADEHGPARPFAIGLTIFVAGLVAAGSAPTMSLLVIARFVQGAGGGAIPAMAYVVAGRGFPPELRPRVFAIMSSAWIVPGLVGLSVSAFITEQFGWRWTFFALLPIAIPVGFATTPVLRALDTNPADTNLVESETATPIDRRPIALLCTAGVALVFVGTSGLPFGLAVACVLIGAVVGGRAYVRLVPDGTIRLRRGLPATIGLRAFQTFSLFGLDAFVPHLIHDVRGYSLALGGAAVTSSAMTWTIGAWVQEHFHGRFAPSTLVSTGLGLVGFGGAGLLATAVDQTPIALGFIAFGICGFGMGLGYSAVSVAMLAEAEPGREGEASAALSVTDVLSTAIATGIGGALIHLAKDQRWSLGSGVMLAFTLPIAAGVAGIFAARRLPHRFGIESPLVELH